VVKHRHKPLPELSPLEMHRVVSLNEAARLAGISDDTLRRRHPDKIVRISPRRVGMRVGDALQLRSDPP
jgi:hypothetical protein